MFYNCSKLQNVILPNKLDIIENYVFYNCTSLLTINIPKTLTKIE